MSSYLKENGLVVTHMLVGAVIGLLVLCGTAKANYGFAPAPPTPPQSTVLMHIEYSHGGGGTYRCADLKDCYVKHLEFEARGAEHYCRKLTITEDGVVKWWRIYN